jgi:rhomboid protease GluP
MSLIKNITEGMLERDYGIVYKLCDSEVVGDDSRYITFAKVSQTVIYGVAVINCSTESSYQEVYARISNFFRAYSDRKPVFCVGIFIGEGEEAEQFCTVNIDDYDVGFNEIRWLVDINKKSIVVNGNQPNKVGDLSAILKSALDNTDTTYSPDMEITDLLKKDGDKRKSQLKSNNIAFTYALIAINCFVMAATYLTGGTGVNNMLNMGALDAGLVFNQGQLYRLFTAMFLHFGIMHLASNMLFLYVFGRSIERYYGKLKFLFIYIGAGLVSSLACCIFDSGAVAAGASGAVFGLVGAMLSCSKKVKHVVDGKDTYFMLMFVVISIASGFVGDDIANSGHIGGLLFGIVAGWLLYDSE